jgi:hypothetical protein
VATLKRLELWPMTGWPDSLWLPELDIDTFTRTARRVCERYDEGLARGGFPPVRRQPRLMAHLHDATTGANDRAAEVYTFWSSGEPGGVVRLPPGVAALSSAERALLVLDTLETALLGLFRRRGWDVSALPVVRRHVMDHDLSWSWSSPVKSNRSRTHMAQAHYVLLDDGFGSTQLEIRDRSTGDVVSRTEPQLAFSTQAGLARSGASVRWLDNATATFVPFRGIFGWDGPEVALHVDDHLTPVAEREALWPRGRSSHARADQGPAISHEPVVDPSRPRPQVVLAAGSS